MKKFYLLYFTTVILLLLIPTSSTNAQSNQSQVDISELETIIEEKLNDRDPLTREELMKTVLEMKNEKISNLEGNLSKVINTVGIVVAVASLFLALFTGIVGWVMKKNLDEKLNKIEEKEININNTYNDIKTKSESIEEYYKKMKEFIHELERTNKKLETNERLLEKREKEFDGLREYVGAIESIANSSILFNQFLGEKEKATDIIEETRELLQTPQKHQEFVMLKLSNKLGMNEELNDLDSIKNHLKYLERELKREEDNILKNINIANNAEELFINHDDNTMEINEELESFINDWKGYLNEILIIKQHWEKNLKLNPIEEQL
ncbi:hypothetical protein HRF87_24790 [Bacillus sp. CRN 9]|nr:hypothetical protein [Bacillus sp. CRN 9]